MQWTDCCQYLEAGRKLGGGIHWCVCVCVWECVCGGGGAQGKAPSPKAILRGAESLLGKIQWLMAGLREAEKPPAKSYELFLSAKIHFL